MRVSPELLKRCWLLAGPTACGKSEAGVELAQRIGAEIIAMDSMSPYRGMDIGTAKPSIQQRGRVPHHLIDLVEPHEEFSVVQYLAEAERACREIAGRGRVPLFVGGTGLYLRSLLRGVFEGPRADAEFRGALEAEVARSGPAALYERLSKVDPESARRLHPRDTRRIIRALEVQALTGKSLSQQQQQSALSGDERPPHVYWLAPPRIWLHERINRRVEQMVGEGLLDEVRRLLASARPLSRTARQALGYKEVIAHLTGHASAEETVAAIQTRTRQFAKRQYTWFRNLEECRAVPMTGDESPADLADRIVAAGATYRLTAS